MYQQTSHPLEMNSTILCLLALAAVCSACPGLFGMGGGGGCGCAPPPPPPPSPCGCGGRKKRSLPSKPEEFFGIASNDGDVLCNTPKLKKIIVENMHPNAVDSSKSLQTALEAETLQRYVVVCTETTFVYTVRANTAYCGAHKNGHYCHVFAL
ncbi:unnamed protein product [Caenorhabditis bovis]|uniref:Ground-like domain-containing protein n=1 Tax=Caenorhabditis bovis TaxID=2654633 RepID=A0A8S1EBR0_9PELO|nr:unnamed protein product [Caenorhabditis bovis]